MVASKPKPVVGQPVKRGGTSVQAACSGTGSKQTALHLYLLVVEQMFLDFSANAFRSGHKIKTLGAAEYGNSIQVPTAS